MFSAPARLRRLAPLRPRGFALLALQWGSARRLLVGLLLVGSLLAGLACQASAQAVEQNNQNNPAAADADAPASDAEPPLSDAEVAEVIGRLGSPRFADREDAMVRARQWGNRILPELRAAAANHENAEVRSRAKFVYSQIVEGDFDARAEAFLAGNDLGDAFPGWDYVSSLMGDKPELREVFVATSRRYPQLMESFDGGARERTLELEHVVHQIQHKMRDLREVPTREDLLATLWGIADPNVLISDEAQGLVLSLLRKAAANELRKNAQLREPFLGVVGMWMRRSPVAGAEQTLALSMQWEMAEESRVLGMRAAYEARDVADVHAGLQAVARFGKPSDVPFVLPFLDDLREDPNARPPAEGWTPVRTSEVATATIAKLYGVPLDELGFPAVQEHPKIGFAIESLGFPAEKPELRQAVSDKLRKLMIEHKHVIAPRITRPSPPEAPETP
ncbi:hypothetical protein [Roseimaritima ulvae]|uniref:Uncharacterized protein n=1 Tax=Roseimaritima ulvae TaxID=980254 RepID=A0A5B9QL99_9BACT|nr:hypothetical protein [Roseimaritima ulvae]QEG38350.1 hypothetical protein UC8_03070 [Roseimaritima ulvae]